MKKKKRKKNNYGGFSIKRNKWEATVASIFSWSKNDVFEQLPYI